MANVVECSPAQTQAINHGEGPMLVLAGPGSGKTFVITRRILTLIEQHHVRPESILVITFTRAAAAEMQERFFRLTKERIYPVTFGTFHAFFYQILRQGSHFGTSGILRESEKKRLLSELLHGMPRELAQACAVSQQDAAEGGMSEDNADMLSSLISDISRVKNLQLNPAEYDSVLGSKAAFAYLYEQYQNYLRTHRKVDFDDMVLLCLQLLRERTDILAQWRERFQYILIDEFQDISPTQYEAVRLLAAPANNLFIVGDDDQSIYGFRGSDPKIMLGFRQDYPEAKEVLLDRNYRSRPQIVEHASNLISHNQHRFDKEVMAASREQGGVSIYPFASRQEETDAIVELIKQYRRQADTRYDDIAIICRTNTNAAMIAPYLQRAGIPFHRQEKSRSLYESAAARDILSYIRYALYEKDVADFYRIMNHPCRYIRRDSVPTRPFGQQELIRNNRDKEYVIHNVINLYHQLDFIKKLNPYAAVNYIRHGVGYDDYIRKNAKENGTSPERQLVELDTLQQKAADFTTLKEWLAYVESGADKEEHAAANAEDAVQIVTMHGSKGLEWKVVLLPDVNEGIVPHKRAVSEAETEEERRMFYVAMTRAKEQLFLFYVQEKTGGKFLPSRFLTELHHREVSRLTSPSVPDTYPLVAR